MRTLNSIHINAAPEIVFKLAAEVENWPRILPHYRWVHVVESRGLSRIVEMAALRTIIPVKWLSVQTLEPQAGRIYYEHIGGPTRGMWVEWTIGRDPNGGTRAVIMHEMDLRVPIVRTPPGKLVTGRFFVSHIAGKTLEHIKRAAEG